MGTTLYCICQVERKIGVEVWGREHLVPLTWAKGMVGAIPVFDNEEDARSAAGGGEVWTVTTPAVISTEDAAGAAKE